MSKEIANTSAPAVSSEQLAYADWLDKGMRIGLAFLVVSFALYVTGITEPVIPLEELPRYWSLPVADYLQAASLSTGWSWLGLAHRGDFMNFVGIAILSIITIVCYGRILIISAKSGQRLFTAIVAGEIMVLCLGASGILAAGH